MLTLVAIVWLIGALLELAVLTRLWGYRRPLTYVVIVFGLSPALAIVTWQLNAWSLLFVFLSAYRFLTQGRLAYDRCNPMYAKRRGLRSYIWFVAASVLCGVLWVLQNQAIFTVPTDLLFLVSAASSLLLGVYAAWASIRWLRVAAGEQTSSRYTDKELPSVTLAIPARNETDQLEATLKAALASDYPKLEILVLDDCSQDKTAQIIKSFAHDGVRFVQGTIPPDERWVHKNYAYHLLTQQASGKIIIFAGVDVLLESQSIRQMVSEFKSRDLHMMTIVPQRPVGEKAFLHAIRIWWEFGQAHDLIRRPPALSSCWLVSRSWLNKNGGFEAVRRMIIPEGHFAKLASGDTKYAVTRGDASRAVVSSKLFKDQYQTLARIRYPQLHRKPELVCGQAALWMMIAVVPLVALIVDVLPGTRQLVLIFTLIGWLGFGISYVVSSRLFQPRFKLHYLVTGWLLALADMAVLHVSMYKYEYGQMSWKGRNVCLPVMHAYPSLPPIDDASTVE